jgi:hypothetical protein
MWGQMSRRDDHDPDLDRSHTASLAPGVSAIQTIEAFWRQITAVFEAAYRVEVDADLPAVTELTRALGVLAKRLEVLRSATRDYAVRELWVLSAMRSARTGV